MAIASGEKTAAEAYQRRFHIVKQTRPGGRCGLLTRYEHVIGPGDAKLGQERPSSFAQAAARAVANHGVADLLGGGEALAGRGAGKGAAAALDNNDSLALAVTLCNKKKFTPHPEAFNLKWRRVDVGREGPLGP